MEVNHEQPTFIYTTYFYFYKREPTKLYHK